MFVPGMGKQKMLCQKHPLRFCPSRGRVRGRQVCSGYTRAQACYGADGDAPGGLRGAGGRWGEDGAEERQRLPVPLAHGRRRRGPGGGGLVFCSPLATALF